MMSEYSRQHVVAVLQETLDRFTAPYDLSIDELVNRMGGSP